MTSLILYITLFPFLLAFCFGMIAVPQLMLTSYTKDVFRRGTVDTPLCQLAGFAFYPILVIVFGLSIVIPQTQWIKDLLTMDVIFQSVSGNSNRLLQLVIGSAFLYLVGLKDDMSRIDSRAKTVVMIAAISLFPVSQLWLNDLHGLFGIHAIPSWIGMPLTIIMGLLITETFKLMDGLDGLASGYGIIISSLLLFCSASSHFSLASITAATLIGVLIPFWLQKMVNKNWRSTMMGDSGSLVIGYIITYLVIGCCRQTYSLGMIDEKYFLLILTSVMLPILENVRVVWSRIRDGRGWKTPDRNQINHKLLRTGLRRWQIATALVGINALFFAVNSLVFVTSISITSLFIFDICYWVILHLVINRFISNRDRRYFRHEWNKVYGREAWTAKIRSNAKSTGGRIRVFTEDDNVSAHTVARWAATNKETAYIPDGMTSFGRNTKRMTDLVIAFFCLIVFSPLFAIIYILVRHEDGGPAIYKQERIGRFGRPFFIYKFRSMRMDAEDAGPALYNATEGDDPRLTKVGRFIRAHHLDELPQVWNVFLGDMAFVGYRPERQFYIDQIVEKDPRYVFLYQIRPGVTSYATLYNGYTDSVEKMVRRLEYDLYYLKHRSWAFDMKILWNTFYSIAHGRKF